MADYSPMMKQYFEVKEKYPNTILFFRLGDFYEMFFNDAKTVSRELELTLTGRDCGQAERAPMCGVPFHSAETYIARLVAKGYKVAICEQMEDPALAKGIVKRSVIRVITPGTVMESSMLDEAKNNYIASIYYFGENIGICFADISTGELDTTTLTAGDPEALSQLVINELARFSPREILRNSRISGTSQNSYPKSSPPRWSAWILRSMRPTRARRPSARSFTRRCSSAPRCLSTGRSSWRSARCSTI